MRFEANHRYFKQLSHIIGNFINITYSLALRQLHQCYLSQNAEHLQGEDLDIGPGKCMF